MRSATVCNPLVTTSGTSSCRGSTSVSGPGQKHSVSRPTSVASRSGTAAIRSSHSQSGKWTISGSKNGRSLASKILSTASGRVASAARPYTVSVGSATGSPAPRKRTASATAQAKFSGESVGRSSVFKLGWRGDITRIPAILKRQNAAIDAPCVSAYAQTSR